MSAHFYRVPLLSVGQVAFLPHKHTGMKKNRGRAVPPIYMIGSSEILGEERFYALLKVEI